MLLTVNDPRLSYWCPQSPRPADDGTVRLERFPKEAYAQLAGQIGPVANLRPSAGCAVFLRTDSPWLVLRLDRLRHHQVLSQGVALEVAQADGSWLGQDSADLREREGALAVRLNTGLERGAPPVVCVLWLPTIATCAVAGIEVADGSRIDEITLPPPRWLALGDSLTQGFSAQSPLATWVHRLSRARNLPAWNLGVGGMQIEPEVVAWALDAKRWDLVTIALGSNHAWRESDVTTVASRAEQLARHALAGGHGRVLWCLPPWKPCEEGKGPADFQGVPLDRATGARVARVRDTLREVLSGFPAITVLDDPLPHDARWYPDGLHPFALGFARYAQVVDALLGSA